MNGKGMRMENMHVIPTPFTSVPATSKIDLVIESWNQPERSNQGDILRVLLQVKDVFSRMKYTYILLLDTSQDS